MGRWKKGETEFRVGLFYDERRGCMLTMPKPLLDLMGRPGSVQFRAEGGRISVEAAE